jgi:hypothetical protein
MQYSGYAVRCNVNRHIPCKYDSVTKNALLLLCNQVRFKEQLLSRQNATQFPATMMFITETEHYINFKHTTIFARMTGYIDYLVKEANK